MDCKKCEDLTQWYREKNPGNMGRGMCPECYEKTLEYSVPVNLKYEPPKRSEEENMKHKIEHFSRTMKQYHKK